MRTFIIITLIAMVMVAAATSAKPCDQGCDAYEMCMCVPISMEMGRQPVDKRQGGENCAYNPGVCPAGQECLISSYYEIVTYGYCVPEGFP